MIYSNNNDNDNDNGNDNDNDIDDNNLITSRALFTFTDQ